MRVFLAVLLVGVGLAGGVAVYEGAADERCAVRGTLLNPCVRYEKERDAWVAPVAILTAFSGIAAGVAIAASGRRKAPVERE